MSIQHPNRREMLATVAVGGAAWCISRRLPAADDLPKLSFVIASDTHLGRQDKEYSEKQWRRAIAEINTLPGEFVLHLGDVVDSGREAQYPIYTELRKTLTKPIYEIPGNHDPENLFRKHVSKETDRVVDKDGVRFVLFNNAHRDSHDGFITPQQIEWLDQQLGDAVKQKMKIVICCHVPIHTNKNPDRGWYVKPANGQTSFYELHKRYSPNILACLHGHFHNGIRGWRDHDQMVEVLCPSVCYNQNRGLTQRIADGKASGFFVDELRPGYLLAEIGAGKFTLKYKPVGEELHGEYSADWS